MGFIVCDSDDFVHRGVVSCWVYVVCGVWAEAEAFSSTRSPTSNN